jgi:hypothetical protein
MYYLQNGHSLARRVDADETLLDVIVEPTSYKKKQWRPVIKYIKEKIDGCGLLSMLHTYNSSFADQVCYALIFNI